MKFIRLSARAAKAVASDNGIPPSEAKVLKAVDRDSRDMVVTAMAAGASGEDAKDALDRVDDMGAYSRLIASGCEHEEAIRRLL